MSLSRMICVQRAASIAFAVAFVFACEQNKDANVVARVNNSPILLEAFENRLNEVGLGEGVPGAANPSVQNLRKRVLNEMIEEQVMLSEAEKLGQTATLDEVNRELYRIRRDYPENSFEAFLASQRMSLARFKDRVRTQLTIQKLLDHVSKAIPQPSQTEIETYYEKHKQDFYQEEQAHLQQIVVKTKEDAEKILEDIQKGETPFEELARRHSLMPEGRQGGDLGYVTKGIMPPGLEKALSKLPLGKPSGIIESDYGFHVVKVLDRKKAQQKTLEEATPDIVRILTQNDRERRIQSWRQEVLSKAKIERNHAAISNQP